MTERLNHVDEPAGPMQARIASDAERGPVPVPKVGSRA
jgi:hypothetical protein